MDLVNNVFLVTVEEATMAIVCHRLDLTVTSIMEQLTLATITRIGDLGLGIIRILCCMAIATTKSTLRMTISSPTIR